MHESFNSWAPKFISWMEVKMCLSVPCWSLFSKDDGQQGAGRRAAAKRRVGTVGEPRLQRLHWTGAVLSSQSNLFPIRSYNQKIVCSFSRGSFPPFPWIVPRLSVSNWDPSRAVFEPLLKHWRFCLNQRNPAGMDYKAPPGLGTKSQSLLGSEFNL